MTGDKEKPQNLSKYKGSRVVMTTNNLKMSIAHIGYTVVPPHMDSLTSFKKIEYVISSHVLILHSKTGWLKGRTST